MENGYVICLNKWALDKTIKSELGLLLIISGLTAQNGVCFAGNEYFSDLFNIDSCTVSRRLNKLKKKGYISISYEKSGNVVLSRKIKINGIEKADDENVNRRLQKRQPPIAETSTADDENVKENNTSINITSINNTNKETREKKAREVAFFKCTPIQKELKVFKSFLDYWTESNEKGKKMKFEMQKTFDWKRRWNTWLNNQSKFGKAEVPRVSVLKTNIQRGKQY